jgi:hypothetical protein
VRIHILFPRLLVVTAGLFFAVNAIAQSSEADSRPATPTVYSNAGSKLETEVSAPPLIEERRPRTVGTGAITPSRPELVAPAISVSNPFDKSLLTSILRGRNRLIAQAWSGERFRMSASIFNVGRRVRTGRRLKCQPKKSNSNSVLWSFSVTWLTSASW